MDQIHGPEEVRLLELLSVVHPLLVNALNSLGGKPVTTAESHYLSWTAATVNRAADAYLYLRQAGRVAASKILVRPAVEALISGAAAMKDRSFLFRKAYSEWLEDKNLLAKDAAGKTKAMKALNELEQAFVRDLPGYPVKREKLTTSQAAKMADMTWLYETQYRLYCQFSHGALRAVSGELDQVTDMADTPTVCWCVLMMLDLLKRYTPAAIAIPDTAPYIKRLLQESGVKPDRSRNIPNQSSPSSKSQ